MSKYEKGEALPIEEGMYNIVNPRLGPFLHEKLGLTPNGITTIAMLMGFVILYFVHKNNYVAAVILLLIRQSFDAADGYVARRYNLQSKFGEMYDHYSDLLTFIPLLLYIAYYSRDFLFNNYLWIVPIIIVYNLILKYRYHCIQKENEAYKNPTIRHEVLKSTKYMSYFESTFILAFAIISVGIKRDAQ